MVIPRATLTEIKSSPPHGGLPGDEPHAGTARVTSHKKLRATSTRSIDRECIVSSHSGCAYMGFISRGSNGSS